MANSGVLGASGQVAAKSRNPTPARRGLSARLQVILLADLLEPAALDVCLHDIASKQAETEFGRGRSAGQHEAGIVAQSPEKRWVGS